MLQQYPQGATDVVQGLQALQAELRHLESRSMQRSRDTGTFQSLAVQLARITQTALQREETMSTVQDILKSIGTPVWYLVANDEGHGFRKKPNIDYQQRAMALFIHTYLTN